LGSGRWKSRGVRVGLALLMTAAVSYGLRTRDSSLAQFSGITMGTTWSARIDARGHTEQELRAAREEIERSLSRIDQRMSTWKSDSELSRFNRHASTAPFSVSGETAEVFRLAAEVGAKTDGAFDISVRPLVAVWGFGAGARERGSEPDPKDLAVARARVGLDRIEVGERAAWVRKRHANVECDLSAIAKGFAIDVAVSQLEELGFEDFLLEIGGELAVRGRRPTGEPWRVGIQLPDGAVGEVEAQLALTDAALATSGDYRDFYLEEGRRRPHIIDPRSGRPVEHGLASVSVVHRSAALADAWATALTVLGPDTGLASAEREGLAAYFLVRTPAQSFEHRETSAFSAFKRSTSASPAKGVAMTLVAAATVFALAVFAMALGYLVCGRPLRGTCGRTGEACACSPLAARRCALRSR